MSFQAPHALLRLDAAFRLGVEPLWWLGWHRLRRAAGLPGRALRPGVAARGPFLPEAAPPPPVLPAGARDGVGAALRALGPAVFHGPFDPGAGALGLDLFAPGDVRPVWEANRLGWVPLLAMAHRLEPGAGHRALAEARLAEWAAANPPFLGPNWACGQEAALRALHLALAHALLGGGPPAAGLAALLRQHAARIGATRAYARAQDNNHGISEPAGLLAIGWALGDARAARRAGRDLARAVARLVAPDGGFAQVSTGYHRLLLDVLSVVEWLRRRHGAGPLPAPFGARAEAAARWLARVVEPDTGGTPRLGHQDGSAFADLSLCGPGDARGSAERALRLFGGASMGWEDAGCAWLGLPPGSVRGGEGAWVAAGTRGWRMGGTRGLLRVGPLRFRPGQADLLHFDLWLGAENLLRDSGTGSYNPGVGRDWWGPHFASAAAHNLVVFDDAEPMPRAGRFLLARWLAAEPLPDGGVVRDARGNRHARRVVPGVGAWRVEDRVSGPFRHLALRWHLARGEWHLTAAGARRGAVELVLSADAPLALSLEEGWESAAYGEVRRAPVLVARARAPVSAVLTEIRFGSGCIEAGDAPKIVSIHQ